MRNKIFFFLIFFVFQFEVLLADQFKFESSEIKIVNNGNLILADKGKATSIDDKIEINAKNFEYQKNIDLLKAYDGVAFLKDREIKINFKEIEFDQKNLVINAKNDIKILDLKNKFSIETNSIFFNQKKNLIKNSTKSIYKDSNNNTIKTKSLEYNMISNIMKINGVNLKDFDNNELNIDLAFLNTKTNRLFGKDVAIELNNKSFNENNEPRMKGNSVISNKDLTEITKGVFTTCKRNDDCPPWQLSAEKIIHDKKKQTINYKNAWLKIYDIPVVYFPKFFHPDPTVKRKSGFLIPAIKNSPTSNNYLSLPYFKVISMNKDFTFTPRFYTDDKVLLQTEYRQVNLNSEHKSDLSIFKEKNNSSKNHFFYNFSKDLQASNYDNSRFDFKIEKTSNDTYLKGNKLTSPLINSYEVLESSMNLDLSKDDLSIITNLTVYENLDKDKKDRYEFILPKIDITKRLKNNTELDGNFLLESSNLIKNYETNITEKININNLIFNSIPKISNIGFYNNYDFIIKNVNTDSKNSKNYKKNENYYISGLLQLNTSLPLIKETNDFQKIMKPKISLKISPDNSKDLSKSEDRIDVNNIFNINRLAKEDTLEGGVSLTYGNEYTLVNKKDSREIFGLKLANNLRFDESEDLPKNTQLSEKTSNFFTEIMFSPNNFLTTKYNSSIKNNLNDISYENFIAELSINNFVTTFDYLNENNTTEKNSYLSNTTKYKLSETNNLIFSTRRNKKTDLTEYYNLVYQYKNDCLAASIEYNKDYYNDRDIKPEESIFFKLTIIPFGDTSSPNLKK